MSRSRAIATSIRRVLVSHRRRVELMRSFLDLNSRDAAAILFLFDREAASRQELAEAVGISPGAASTLVDRMVERGILARCTDMWDQRRAVVSLEPAFRSRMEPVEHRLTEPVRRLVDDYSESDQELIHDFLCRLVEIYEGPVPELGRDA